MVVPACQGDPLNPQHHSVTNQKLLCVDWEWTHGMEVPCPDPVCEGTLKSDRTNFSKNKTLFPTCGLDGSPSWCIVIVLTCPCCRRNFKANEVDMLINMPACAADAYPMETTCALPTACHLARHAAEVFSSVVVTYGNGEICSKLLFNAMNCDHVQRLKIYYSMAKEKKDVRLLQAPRQQQHQPASKKMVHSFGSGHHLVIQFETCAMLQLQVQRTHGVSVFMTDRQERFRVSNVIPSLDKTMPFRSKRTIRGRWELWQCGMQQRQLERSQQLHWFPPCGTTAVKAS